MGFLWWFAVVALAEMATFFWVSSEIGLGAAIFIALSTAFVGAYLVRRSGVAVWRRLRARVKEQRIPGRELVAGVAVLVAGAFLISPGFITDILGFLLLVPWAQDRLYEMVTARFSARFAGLRAAGDSLRGAVEGDWGTEVTDIVDIEEVD